MRKTVFTLFVSIVFSSLIFAQTDVIFRVDHQLGDTVFELNKTAENNLGQSFNARRMEYYFSQIYIVHDGGKEILVEDIYILANGTNSVYKDLGNFDITEVEAVKFSIGIDSITNHEDPAQYDTRHPLGLKFPSMHWGWDAGYRFAAIEGMGGNLLDKDIQIHSMGDNNYFQTEIASKATAENGVVFIDLVADCSRALDDIDLSQGLIEHSGVRAAVTVLENFRDHVFTSAERNTSIENLAKIQSFEIFPNPSFSNEISLNFSSLENTVYQVIVSNLLGQQLQSIEVFSGQKQINLKIQNKGIYLLTLIKEGKMLTSKRLIIQ